MIKDRIFNIYNAVTNELLYSIDTKQFSTSTVSDMICDIIFDSLYNNIDIIIKVAYKTN